MKKIITSTIICASVLLMIPIVSTFAAAAPEDFNEQPVIDNGVLVLPEGPDGYKVELFGSDRKEVIGLDGKITKPIQDVDVKLIYKLTKDGKKDVVTKNISVPVSKRSDVPNGANKKPDIIPAIREWAGGTGNFVLKDDAEIVIADESLSATAEMFQKDLLEVTQKNLKIRNGEPVAGDIYLDKTDELSELGIDGYFIDNSSNDFVAVKANSEKGVFYGTVTIMQILKLDDDHVTFPKGFVRDYPKYETRGMMIDVARKYIPLEFLDDYVKYLSWYKMSDIEVHLNDNEIFGDNASRPYPVSGDEPYVAFRLESDIPGLTSTDGSYTKEEFRQFQNQASLLGVNVIPEIDVPGHSMAFTRVRPDLKLVDPTSYKGASYDHVEKYLDVRNPGTLPFVQQVFDEYMDGPNPVFVGKDVHFGTDEYSNSYDTQNINKGFRNFAKEMTDYVTNKPHYSNGEVDGTYNASLWGGFSRYGSEGANTNATLYNWNQGFGNPIDMVNLGFNLVNIDDSNLYIVPGSPVEPAYPQNLNNSNLYNNWEPINFTGKTPFQSGHPQIKGGMFAIWNDNHGNGKSVADLYEVSKQSVQVLADKNWSGSEGTAQRNFDTFAKLGDKLADAPNADLDHKVSVKDNVVIDADFENSIIENKNNVDGAVLTDPVNVELGQGKQGQGAVFQVGESYVKTSMSALGFGWSAEMWIKPDQNNNEDAILMESNPDSQDLHTSVKLKQGETSKIGFSVENYDHYFNYEIPANFWTHIALTGDSNGTSLYVNGQFKERLEGRLIPNGNYSGPKYYETLQLPIEYIGSTTNSFAGTIDNMKVYNKVISSDQILKDAGIIFNVDSGNIALKKPVMSENADYANPPHRVLGSITDGVITTSVDNRWAPHVSGTTQKDYRFTIDFGSLQSIERAVIFERIFNAPSVVTSVTIQKFVGDETDEAAWRKDASWETIQSYSKGLEQKGTEFKFDPTITSKIRFIITTTPDGSTWRDLSLMEVEVYGSNVRKEFSNVLNNGVDIYNLVNDRLVDLADLESAITEGLDILTNENISDEEIIKVKNKLEIAINSALNDYRSMNIAKNKSATASGKEANLDRLGAEKAFDGDYEDMMNGRWSSETGNDDAWLRVDLGKTEIIDQVNIWWETAYAKKFKLQTSEDGINYTDVYVQSIGTGGTEVIKFEPVNARYVRMQGVKRRTDNSDVQTYSIFEMEVFRHGLLSASNIDLGEDFRILEGSTQILKPTFAPEGATDIAVTYTSTNEEVASVDEKGVVKAIQAGTTEIQAVLKSNSEVTDTVQLMVIAPANKEALSAAIQDANSLSDFELSNLDKTLAAEFARLYKLANQLREDKLALQSEVDQVVNDLNACTHAIRTSDLDAAITKAQIMVEHIKQYENQGKDELNAAYLNAVTIRENTSSTYEELEKARVRLNTAIDNMVIIDIDELLSEYKVANLYALDKFKAESKVGFVEALESAKTCLSDPISKENVKEVRLNLNQHVNALRYIPTKENFDEGIKDLTTLDVNVMLAISDTVQKLSDRSLSIRNVFGLILDTIHLYEEVVE